LNSDEKLRRASVARRAARLFLSAAAALFLPWILASAVVAWKLTHRARTPYAEPLPAWAADHSEEIRLETRDGERLGAWFSPSTATDVSVLVLHGNGGSRSAEAGLLRELSAEHVPVLATTLRAHGDSTGATNDFGWSARADVIASVAFLERRLPGTRIVVLGNSLGAVAAIYAAGELGHRVAAYVLEAPYRDIRAAARHRLELRLPHPLDNLAYAGLLLLARPMLSARLDDLSPIDRIADVPADVPLVFLSGTEDRLAPIAEVEEIRSRCAARARLVAFPGGAHQDLSSTDPDRYAAALRETFARIREP
jgi:pimeloyl-ACP methyl ester carboxylesterase